jgi:hypothetical protein
VQKTKIKYCYKTATNVRWNNFYDLLIDKDVYNISSDWEYDCSYFLKIFCVEIYQNDIFLFLKIIFEISASKQSKFLLKKINFFKNTGQLHFQMLYI